MCGGTWRNSVFKLDAVKKTYKYSHSTVLGETYVGCIKDLNIAETFKGYT